MNSAGSVKRILRLICSSWEILPWVRSEIVGVEPRAVMGRDQGWQCRSTRTGIYPHLTNLLPKHLKRGVPKVLTWPTDLTWLCVRFRPRFCMILATQLSAPPSHVCLPLKIFLNLAGEKGRFHKQPDFNVIVLWL